MDILFWSGGKDSYLALQFFKEAYRHDSIKLLTTYEEGTDFIPHQQLSLATIREQAQALGLELITVALPKDCPNKTYFAKVKQALENEGSINNLVFGDWHLEDIKHWREEVFGEMGYQCRFPIWGKSLNELLPALLLKPVEIRISAVSEKYQAYLKVGEQYNQHLIRQLPDEIDPMGENGEFHTEVIFKDFPKL